MNWEQNKMMFGRDSSVKLEWHLGVSTIAPREVQACMKSWHFDVNSLISLESITHLSLLKVPIQRNQKVQPDFVYSLLEAAGVTLHRNYHKNGTSLSIPKQRLTEKWWHYAKTCFPRQRLTEKW